MGLEGKAEFWPALAFRFDLSPNGGPNGGFDILALGAFISSWKSFCCSDSLIEALRMDPWKAPFAVPFKTESGNSRTFQYVYVDEFLESLGLAGVT